MKIFSLITCNKKSKKNMKPWTNVDNRLNGRIYHEFMGRILKSAQRITRLHQPPDVKLGVLKE